MIGNEEGTLRGADLIEGVVKLLLVRNAEAVIRAVLAHVGVRLGGELLEIGNGVGTADGIKQLIVAEDRFYLREGGGVVVFARVGGAGAEYVILTVILIRSAGE